MAAKKNKQVNTAIARVLRDFANRVAAATPEQVREMRERLREQRQVVFVRTYTVQAHFRPARPRKGDAQ